ncbi:Ig-like domain-containing protein [Melaminivora jejuensis]|uniref:Ig-like domain-containing protein n=1 Tax=Melaminivora jejuensis TaxID=1267217 RepID=UPI001ADED9D3|nr:Ig-like domain-containing protein [Melaminivora jejuensis]
MSGYGQGQGWQSDPGTVVTFSQEGSALLEFIPESATALTNKDGVAEVDVKAKDAQALGATQIVATVKVVDRTGQERWQTGRQSVSVSPTVVADPQAAAAAINFSKANPSDSSIVIAGSGGNGRSETALLTFTVVDGQGSPLKGVVVDFNVVPAGSVNLLTTQGTTNSAGEITVSVSSKENPVSVIVNARVRERNISTQI